MESIEPGETPKLSRKTRSRSGCRICRARKVKCDERPGGCTNCERLGLPCASYYTRGQEQEPSDIARVENHAGLSKQNLTTDSFRRKRERIYRACVECRMSKTKCNGVKPSCMRCQQRRIKCMYEKTPQSLPAWAQRLTVPANPAYTTDVASLSDGAREVDTIPVTPNDACRSTSPDPLQQSTATIVDDKTSLSWLISPTLPPAKQAKLLAEQYFTNIHPLRCFAFIHKPSFLQNMETRGLPRERNALLHIICALGAQFYALEQQEEGHSLEPGFIRAAGSQWATTAQHLILTDLDQISVQNLMAAHLLQDYVVRIGNYALAFMLSAMVSRMSQALQINLEYSTDILCKETERHPSITIRESRRRLMWSCYVADSLVGSGVDQLTMINDDDLKIQLPCNERNFTQQIICITETLRDRQPLPFIAPELRPSNAQDNMGIAAYFLRHMEIRRRVLRYIKHLDKAKLPWLPDSEFSVLDAECKAWYNSLPPSLQFTSTAVYIRKDTRQLGALCILHCGYHETMCDLYRIGAPHLYKVRAAFDFPQEQSPFLHSVQWTLFEHARSIAKIVEETMRHGTRILADSWLPSIIYDSCRIMVYYLTQLIDPSDTKNTPLTLETVPLLERNVKALKRMQALHAVAEPLYLAANTMLEKFGLYSQNFERIDIIPDDPYQPEKGEGYVYSPACFQRTRDDPYSRTRARGSPPQSTPEYVLNPLSIYRMARKAIPEKHAPETVAPSNRATTSESAFHTSRQTNRSTFTDGSLPGTPPVFERAMFDELQIYFTSDLGWAWQPAETVVGSGTQDTGLFPCAPGFQGGRDPDDVPGQLDLWMPNSDLDGIV